MGWLPDIGNVAVGAIERDREITKEDLIIRGENLKANQQLLVDQKKKIITRCRTVSIVNILSSLP